jgi:ABC-type transport system involved in cytochrome bd biosynthesis fused ATPase/permease subunit
MDTIARTSYISLYEQRVQLVAHALKQNSELSEKDAGDLAVHVLYALDHIPEKVR